MTNTGLASSDDDRREYVKQLFIERVYCTAGSREMSGGLGVAPNCRNSLAVVSDLMKFPPVWTPSAITNGVHDRLFVASISAPRSTRNCTMESARSRHATP